MINKGRIYLVVPFDIFQNLVQYFNLCKNVHSEFWEHNFAITVSICVQYQNTFCSIRIIKSFLFSSYLNDFGKLSKMVLREAWDTGLQVLINGKILMHYSGIIYVSINLASVSTYFYSATKISNNSITTSCLVLAWERMKEIATLLMNNYC